MADNNSQFASAVEALFQGIDQLVTTKTVVGEAIRVDDAIIVPLMDVTCGMAAGSFDENAKKRGGGGMSAKMSPNIKNQNTVNKMLDMVPDLVNRFTGGKVQVGEQFSPDAMAAAEEMASSAEKTGEKDRSQT